MSVHLAVDLGAGSGRVIAGIFDGRTLRLEEMARFPNEGLRLPGGSHWNVTQLFADITRGIGAAAGKFGKSVTSVAVDTWGVDYGLLDARGHLLGLPWMYRDERTNGFMAAAQRLMPREEIYRRTGIQFLPFNTAYQLMAESTAILEAADRLLFMPDLLAYWLSGERAVERTIASTSQLLAAGRPEWDAGLAAALGIPAKILGPLTEPGTKLGPLRREVCAEGAHVQVVTCGGHDTASAVAGVPASHPDPLFLSSGTWSLLGRELPSARTEAADFEAGFSNEHGLCGTTRYLKNIAGMWLLQECKRAWDAGGTPVDFEALVREAGHAATPMVLDPDAEIFAHPSDMPEAIRRFARETGQRAPSSRGEFARVIFEGLALKYRTTLEKLRATMPDLPDTLHIVGGGSRNALLNQLAADATGMEVIAGPVEATAAGNILAQLMAAGEIASLEEGRAILRASFPLQTFTPGDSAPWAEKSARLSGAQAGS